MTATWWIKAESEAARCFWMGDPGAPVVPGLVWVPRSVTPYIRIFRKPEDGARGPWPKCEVEIEEWWWRKECERRAKGRNGQKELGL
jgi:hypothetical protein